MKKTKTQDPLDGFTKLKKEQIQNLIDYGFFYVDVGDGYFRKITNKDVYIDREVLEKIRKEMDEDAQKTEL